MTVITQRDAFFSIFIIGKADFMEYKYLKNKKLQVICFLEKERGKKPPKISP
jgi:hypothetical protein